MASPPRFPLFLAGTATVGVLLASSPTPGQSRPDSVPADGFAVRSQTVIDRCSRCHAVDDEGRMTRISYLRLSLIHI